MKVIIKEEDFKTVKALLTEAEADGVGSSYRLQSGKGKLKLDIARFCPETLDKLYEFLSKKGADGDRSAKMSAKLVKQWKEIKKDPAGQVVTKLENVASAMTEYIRSSEHKWVFQMCRDGNMLPWFVRKVKYNGPSQYTPAHVKVHLTSVGKEESGRSGGKSITIHADEFKGKTMSEILERHNYYLETPERFTSYETELERWIEHCDEDGFQMTVSGMIKEVEGWRSDYCPAEKAGRTAKMVVDPDGDAKGRQAMTCGFWEDGSDDEPEDGEMFRLPIHPLSRMFDLDDHSHYIVHINNMTPYVYDTEVGEKLVLPSDVKELLEILIEHAQASFVDIVSGKEGGTIILLEGPPGVGKTLSAEVYAEVMERPLYRVQSSQLGTTPQQLEEQLKKVLERAERWGAILLIDEADVYIHERGADIIQNAIVGVSLRVLEYYRGVLFMTTNRGTVIDDAIVSRLTARFRYQQPGREEQVELWKILADQNNIKLPEGEIPLLVSKLPGLSGRDIKNLLKLAHVVSIKRGTDITVDLVSYLARFRQTQAKEVAE